jgi:hypothetical protein
MLTFRVSDVECDRTRLATTDIAGQLAKLGWTKTEAHRVGATELIDGLRVHPFVLAVHLAFAQHRPLVITPDAVWLCIAQSLATHIELNAAALRPRLVRHAGKLALDVRRDGFVPGAPRNDWPGVVDELVAQIRVHLGGRADMFVADFSTTGPLDRTASQIALMGAMREYFSYGVTTMCGIPEITLTGTPEDWASMRRRAAAFRELDLAWWVAALDPVLAKLEATARGRIDREFWRRLYKLESASGGDRTFGWMNALFAYVEDPPQRNTFPTIDNSSFDGNLLSDFPPGRTRAPFTWRLLGTPVEMELIGGLWGVTQDARGALGVASGWVVNRARGALEFLRTGGEDGAPAQLQARDGRELETLAGLGFEAGDEPVSLTLWSSDRLRSIDGIQHLRGLISLSLSDAPRLESVAPLAGMTSLIDLDLRDCPRLAGLGPVLDTLPQLESLSLTGNTRLQLADILPIAWMPRLKQVALMGCTGLPEHLRYLYRWDTIADLRAELAGLAGHR